MPNTDGSQTMLEKNAMPIAGIAIIAVIIAVVFMILYFKQKDGFTHMMVRQDMCKNFREGTPEHNACKANEVCKNFQGHDHWLCKNGVQGLLQGAVDLKRGELKKGSLQLKNAVDTLTKIPPQQVVDSYPALKHMPESDRKKFNQGFTEFNDIAPSLVQTASTAGTWSQEIINRLPPSPQAS